MPQSGDPLIQVKEEPPNSLLGETSGAGNSGMLNTYSLNGVLQSGQCGMRSLFGLSVLLGQSSFHFLLFFMFLHTESKSDRGNLYNFSKLKKSRKWLKVRDKANIYNSNNLLKLQIERKVIDSFWHIGRDFSREESSILGVVF